MLEISNLVHTFGSFVLGPISCRIQPGLTLILGPNGSGKSTLLNLLAGLVRPDQGNIRVDGTDLRDCSDVRRAALLAYAPQQPMASPGLSTAEFVAMGLYRKTRAIYSDPQARTVVAEALATAVLTDRADIRFENLSGGEQRRASVARALIQEASWTLLDEPAGFLDYAHNHALHADLLRMRMAGRNLVVVTHDADFAAALADQVLLMRQGRILHQGSATLLADTTLLQEVFGTDFIRTPGGRILQKYRDTDEQPALSTRRR